MSEIDRLRSLCAEFAAVCDAVVARIAAAHQTIREQRSQIAALAASYAEAERHRKNAVTEAAALKAEASRLQATVKDLTQQLAAMEQAAAEASAATFDEEWYLRTYPDVRAAVEQGVTLSGRQHYELHGRNEGRQPLPPPP
jgi:chromosome segregation ATPase